MTKQEYSKYLKSEHWLNFRLVVLSFWGNRCSVCNKGGCVLDVHHRTYERLWNERLEDVVVLCRDCHDLFTREFKNLLPNLKQSIVHSVMSRDEFRIFNIYNDYE